MGKTWTSQGILYHPGKPEKCREFNLETEIFEFVHYNL